MFYRQYRFVETPRNILKKRIVLTRWYSSIWMEKREGERERREEERESKCGGETQRNKQGQGNREE